MNHASHERNVRLTVTALLVALIVVLQVFSSFVHFGPFAITLTLIPLVLGGILLGARGGAALGALFGAVVYFFCIIGTDAGGFILFGVNPWLTALVCIGKGALAGFCSALCYRALSKKAFLPAVIVAAVTAPIVNTGSFLAGMFLFFRPQLIEWAGGTNLGVYVITGLVGVNFLVEAAVCTVLSPALASIVRTVTTGKRFNLFKR